MPELEQSAINFLPLIEPKFGSHEDFSFEREVLCKS
jgi:hypothetical protein